MESGCSPWWLDSAVFVQAIVLGAGYMFTAHSRSYLWH
ncbi:hypothetical protein ART_4270 [Arthrobacter sp. PAMC 25486]|nr:hypothetical protein ART_4270 [Arthrobacter sp. PAMC 25486]